MPKAICQFLEKLDMANGTYLQQIFSDKVEDEAFLRDAFDREKRQLAIPILTEQRNNACRNVRYHAIVGGVAAVLYLVSLITIHGQVPSLLVYGMIFALLSVFFNGIRYLALYSKVDSRLLILKLLERLTETATMVI